MPSLLVNAAEEKTADSPNMPIEGASTPTSQSVNTALIATREISPKEKAQSKDSWKQWPAWLRDCNPYKPGSKFSDQFDVGVSKTSKDNIGDGEESQIVPKDSQTRLCGPPPVPLGDQRESPRENDDPSEVTDAAGKFGYNHKEVVSLVSNSWQKVEKEKSGTVYSAGAVPLPANEANMNMVVQVEVREVQENHGQLGKITVLKRPNAWKRVPTLVNPGLLTMEGVSQKGSSILNRTLIENHKTKSLEQRQEEYALARLRIMGSTGYETFSIGRATETLITTSS